MPWVFNPHSGGTKIPDAVRDRTRRRILAHAEKHYAGRYTSLDIRFRGALCYIDAYVEPDVPNDWPPKDWGETREEMIERLRRTPVHLVRLRFFGDDRWSLALPVSWRGTVAQYAGRLHRCTGHQGQHVAWRGAGVDRPGPDAAGGSLYAAGKLPACAGQSVT